MAYRETARTRANVAHRRSRIEHAARLVITDSGFAGASIAAVARRANCSTGLIYSYYASRNELLRTAFAHASGHELAVVTEAVAACSVPAEVADAVVDVFVRRAVQGRPLAHALMFEDVPEPVQLERLALRRGYVSAIAAGIERTVTSHGGCTRELTRATARSNLRMRADVFARSLVGALTENLVDVLDLSRAVPSAEEIDALIATVAEFARCALVALDPAAPARTAVAGTAAADPAAADPAPADPTAARTVPAGTAEQPVPPCDTNRGVRR